MRGGPRHAIQQVRHELGRGQAAPRAPLLCSPQQPPCWPNEPSQRGWFDGREAELGLGHRRAWRSEGDLSYANQWEPPQQANQWDPRQQANQWDPRQQANQWEPHQQPNQWESHQQANQWDPRQQANQWDPPNQWGPRQQANQWEPHQQAHQWQQDPRCNQDNHSRFFEQWAEPGPGPGPGPVQQDPRLNRVPGDNQDSWRWGYSPWPAQQQQHLAPHQGGWGGYQEGPPLPTPPWALPRAPSVAQPRVPPVMQPRAPPVMQPRAPLLAKPLPPPLTRPRVPPLPVTQPSAPPVTSSNMTVSSIFSGVQNSSKSSDAPSKQMSFNAIARVRSLSPVEEPRMKISKHDPRKSSTDRDDKRVQNCGKPGRQSKSSHGSTLNNNVSVSYQTTELQRVCPAEPHTLSVRPSLTNQRSSEDLPRKHSDIRRLLSESERKSSSNSVCGRSPLPPSQAEHSIPEDSQSIATSITCPQPGLIEKHVDSAKKVKSKPLTEDNEIATLKRPVKHPNPPSSSSQSLVPENVLGSDRENTELCMKKGSNKEKKEYVKKNDAPQKIVQKNSSVIVSRGTKQRTSEDNITVSQASEPMLPELVEKCQSVNKKSEPIRGCNDLEKRRIASNEKRVKEKDGKSLASSMSDHRSKEISKASSQMTELNVENNISESDLGRRKSKSSSKESKKRESDVSSEFNKSRHSSSSDKRTSKKSDSASKKSDSASGKDSRSKTSQESCHQSHRKSNSSQTSKEPSRSSKCKSGGIEDSALYPPKFNSAFRIPKKSLPNPLLTEIPATPVKLVKKTPETWLQQSSKPGSLNPKNVPSIVLCRGGREGIANEWRIDRIAPTDEVTKSPAKALSALQAIKESYSTGQVSDKPEAVNRKASSKCDVVDVLEGRTDVDLGLEVQVAQKTCSRHILDSRDDDSIIARMTSGRTSKKKRPSRPKSNANPGTELDGSVGSEPVQPQPSTPSRRKTKRSKSKSSGSPLKTRRSGSRASTPTSKSSSRKSKKRRYSDDSIDWTPSRRSRSRASNAQSRCSSEASCRMPSPTGIASRTRSRTRSPSAKRVLYSERYSTDSGSSGENESFSDWSRDRIDNWLCESGSPPPDDIPDDPLGALCPASYRVSLRNSLRDNYLKKKIFAQKENYVSIAETENMPVHAESTIDGYLEDGRREEGAKSVISTPSTVIRSDCLDTPPPTLARSVTLTPQPIINNDSDDLHSPPMPQLCPFSEASPLHREVVPEPSVPPNLKSSENPVPQSCPGEETSSFKKNEVIIIEVETAPTIKHVPEIIDLDNDHMFDVNLPFDKLWSSIPPNLRCMLDILEGCLQLTMTETQNFIKMYRAAERVKAFILRERKLENVRADFLRNFNCHWVDTQQALLSLSETLSERDVFTILQKKAIFSNSNDTDPYSIMHDMKCLHELINNPTIGKLSRNCSTSDVIVASNLFGLRESKKEKFSRTPDLAKAACSQSSRSVEGIQPLNLELYTACENKVMPEIRMEQSVPQGVHFDQPETPRIPSRDSGCSVSPLRNASSASDNSACMEPQSEQLVKICFKCEEEATIVCSACKSAVYCSAICQAAHWEEVHSLECQH